MAFFDSDSHDLESFRWCLSSVGTLRAFVFFFFYDKEGRFLFPILLLFRAMKEEMFLSLIVFPHLNSWVDIVSSWPPLKKKSIWATFQGGQMALIKGSYLTPICLGWPRVHALQTKNKAGRFGFVVLKGCPATSLDGRPGMVGSA